VKRIGLVILVGVLVLGVVGGAVAYMSNALDMVGSGVVGTLKTTYGGSDNSTGNYEATSEVAPFTVCFTAE